MVAKVNRVVFRRIVLTPFLVSVEFITKLYFCHMEMRVGYGAGSSCGAGCSAWARARHFCMIGIMMLAIRAMMRIGRIQIITS